MPIRVLLLLGLITLCYQPFAAQAEVRQERVVSLLTRAASCTDLGRYDDALAAFQEVLLIDPYNAAARRGMEIVEREKAKYFEAAADQARSRALRDVDRQWKQDLGPLFGVLSPDASDVWQTLVIERKTNHQAELLNEMVARISFADVGIDEAVEYLRVKSRDSDRTKLGLNIVVTPEAMAAGHRLSLQLDQVSYRSALNAITSLSGLIWHEDANAIVISGNERAALVSKQFAVPPDFMATAELLAPSGVGANKGFIVTRMTTTGQLRAMGIEMPEGAGASYSRNTNTLIVRTTVRGLGLLDELIEQHRGKASRQFMVAVKMIEINHEALEQMHRKGGTGSSTLAGGKRLFGLTGSSEDDGPGWLGGIQMAGMLSSLAGVSKVNFGSFGASLGSGMPSADGAMPSTSGAAPSASGATSTSNGAARSASGATSTSNGAGPSLAGQGSLDMNHTQMSGVPMVPRSGQRGAGSGSAARAVTSPGSSSGGSATFSTTQSTPSVSQSPGSFSLSGVLSNPMFSQLLQAMRQHKGTDVMVMPSVLATSGHRSSIKIAREFPYPTEFDAPQVPQSVGQYQIGNTQYSGTGSNRGPVTPTTPTAFDKRDVGFTLEVEGVVSDDRKTIELNLQPDWTEFEGFINYGEPIYEIGADGSQQMRTENKIQQAIFRATRTRGVVISIYSGATVVFAGLLDERRTKGGQGGSAGLLSGVAGGGSQSLPKKRIIVLAVTATVQTL
jgi:type II secretory pathway component GspD/PulD (secretin)